MLALFDVIWIFDRNTRPQKRKMYVCLSYERGWFMRINSNDNIRPCAPIAQADNDFLDHDSHIECGLLELDEYEIEEAIRSDGVIGTVSLAYKQAVMDGLMKALYIRQSDKDIIKTILSQSHR